MTTSNRNLLYTRSLGTKLSLALVASFGLSAAASVFGLAQLHAANRHVLEVETTWSPRIEVLQDLRVSLERANLLATRKTQTTNFRHLAEVETAQRRTSAEMDALLSAFARTPLMPEERNLFDTFTGLLKEQQEIQQRISRHIASGEVRPATLLHEGQLRITFARSEQTLADLTRAAQEEKSVAFGRAERAYEVALAHASFAAALAAILAFAVVLWVRSHIGAPLLRLAVAVQRLAAGDLSGTRAGTNRQDEIGTLSAAVEMYRKSLVRSRELAAAEQLHRDRLEAAVTNMPVGLCMFDGHGRLVVSNERFLDTYGLNAAAFRPGTDLRQIIDAAPCFPAELGAAGTAKLAQLLDRIELPNGRVIRVIRAALPDGGWVAIHEDMTDRSRAEKQIYFMAHHDALTGLPNRVQFREKIGDAVVMAECGFRCAVLLLDLDRFKLVNDTLGHPAGDKLLRAVAERIRSNVQEADCVARLGGDEFALIMPGIHHPADAEAAARKLVEALSTPFEIDGHQLVIGSSIGIALLPSDGNDPDLVIRNADLALYCAKADGRGTWRFFAAEMSAAMQFRRGLELDLRRALERQEFELFYQPIADLHAGTVTGFEALLRWRHPYHGLISPADFIPLAEENGLILPIGEWVLHHACREASGWPRHLKLAVNISAAQFIGAGPKQAVMAALAASGLAPSRLELEITETVVLSDSTRTIRMLQELKMLGVSIAMDDFGAGVSSLAYLRKFPFDRLKIDRSLMSTHDETPAGSATVRAILDLCESLNIMVTAEGIETAGQLALLQGRMICAQGYLFGRPSPASQLPSLFGDLTIRAIDCGTAIEAEPEPGPTVLS